MLDMSWGEVLVIGAVALVVIGPKDLPKALRTLGNMTSQLRRMAGEFQTQFNEAMREAELDDIKKQVSGLNEQVSSINTEVSSLNTAFDPITGSSTPLPGAAPTASENAGAATPAPTAAPLPGEPAFDLALPQVAPAPDIPSAPEPAGAPEPQTHAAETKA
jgi:sec-independent protein translocase protein TatB